MIYNPDTTTDWRNQAQCRDVDPNVMQPERASAEQVQDALDTCIGCPVFELCKKDAASQENPYGVWAGEWHGDTPRQVAQPCQWCGKAARVGAKFCGGPCRSASHRAKDRLVELSA